MNIKDLFFPFLLTVSTVLLINYFFFGKKDVGQYQFTAPQTAVECVPLNRNLNFVDTKRVASKIETVETSWGNLEFSTNGAALTRLEFERQMDHKTQFISTIFPPDQDEKEDRAFVVGLNEQAPYVYRLSDRRETDDTIELEFEGSSDQARIKKTFVIYKHIHQMDLKLSIDPKGDNVVQARLFYPAPIMPALKEQNQTAGDLIYGADTFKKLYRDSIKPDTFWLNPSLFGTENKYFMHSLVKDADGFAQRAYYKIVGQKQLLAIVEGPATNSEMEWTLSFYLGPKEGKAMSAVDQRLEKALDYSGFWAPISRLLLLILNWLFDYLHNYGWAIVILTLLIKLVLIPFSLRGERGMKERTETQKKLQYIKQKYKHDSQARTQAEMEHMKNHGLGLGSCLPMFAQVPIFFGLSRVLSSSIEMYGASFLWMKDLSAPDPYYILPVIVVIGMLGSTATAGSTQQRLPMIAMGIGFGAVSASFSAGLVLYLALSGALNVVQTRLFKLFRLVG
ncbi:membrane protein insertase YidC [Candidatus Dependentiae bacterium]|nr:MAG: membrane protein insertase YidC [Candidatus Dependentiae bacterium]